jgi:hypothetical protein
LLRVTGNGAARDGRPMIVAEIQMPSDGALAAPAMMRVALVGERVKA